MIRAVFDTNIFVSAFLSRNPTSPTQELISRWQNQEFSLLMCDSLLDEIAEKFEAKKISQARIIEFLMLLEQLAEWVDLSAELVEAVIIADHDDDVILACAVVGQADYLVSYDRHVQNLGNEYRGIKIVAALPFLWAVRNYDKQGDNS